MSDTPYELVREKTKDPLPKKITRELIDELFKTTGRFPPPEDGSNRYSEEELQVFTDKEKLLMPTTTERRQQRNIKRGVDSDTGEEWEIVYGCNQVWEHHLVYLYKHPSWNYRAGEEPNKSPHKIGLSTEIDRLMKRYKPSLTEFIDELKRVFPFTYKSHIKE